MFKFRISGKDRADLSILTENYKDADPMRIVRIFIKGWHH